MAPKPPQDLWLDCYDGNQRKMISPEDFRKNFCEACMNAGCVNSKGVGTSWVKRIATQEERLLINPNFADMNDPRWGGLAGNDFKNMIQEALAIEISTRRGDWSIPTQEEIGRAAAEVVGFIPAPPAKLVDEVAVTGLDGKALLPPKTKAPKEREVQVVTEVEAEPPAPEPPATEPPELKGSWKVLGDSGNLYQVTLGEGDIWACTCKGFQYGGGQDCKHIATTRRRAQVSPPPETPTPPPAPPTRPPGPPLNAYNQPPKSGIMIGGGPAPDQNDPWAVPTQKPTEKVIPVGGKVSFKRK